MEDVVRLGALIVRGVLLVGDLLLGVLEFADMVWSLFRRKNDPAEAATAPDDPSRTADRAEPDP